MQPAFTDTLCLLAASSRHRKTMYSINSNAFVVGAVQGSVSVVVSLDYTWHVYLAPLSPRELDFWLAAKYLYQPIKNIFYYCCPMESASAPSAATLYIYSYGWNKRNINIPLRADNVEKQTYRRALLCGITWVEIAPTAVACWQDVSLTWPDCTSRGSDGATPYH